MVHEDVFCCEVPPLRDAARELHNLRGFGDADFLASFEDAGAGGFGAFLVVVVRVAAALTELSNLRLVLQEFAGVCPGF